MCLTSLLLGFGIFKINTKSISGLSWLVSRLEALEKINCTCLTRIPYALFAKTSTEFNLSQRALRLMCLRDREL